MPVITYDIDEEIKWGASRFAANDKLIEIANKDKNLFFVTNDNTADKSPQEKLKNILGERYIDCGIAEQNAVGISCGLALSGKRVVCQSFASFLTLRSIEAIYLDTAYNGASVIFMGTHCGVSNSTGGPTHGALMDVAYTRVMPNMTVIVPSDPFIASHAIEAAINSPGPVYFRVAKGVEPRVYKEDITEFKMGKGLLIYRGNDITLIGCGAGVWTCLRAAQLLERCGINARVIDMHTIKPLDTEIIECAARETGGIITCEDHYTTGGLGSAVAETVASLGLPVIVKRLGMPDCFFEQGDNAEQIYSYYGYDANGVYNAAKTILVK